MQENQGCVFWITGLSGAGKTTIGSILVKKLKEHNAPALLVDGDVIRSTLSEKRGYTREERLHLSKMYSKFCHMVAQQGIHVVCACVALFHEVQAWNRKNMARYLEIFVDVPLDDLIKRDTKNIYAEALKGKIKNVVGIDIEPEYPQNPDLVLSNDYENADYQAARIFDLYASQAFCSANY